MREKRSGAAAGRLRRSRSFLLLAAFSLCLLCLLLAGVVIWARHLPVFPARAGCVAADLPPADASPAVTAAGLQKPPYPASHIYQPVYDPASGERLPVLALTFDDGPNSTITPRLIDALNERGIHATFFMLGRLAERNPEVVAYAYASGHQICSHGWAHEYRLTTLDDAGLAVEVEDTARVIRNITGEDPSYLRPPYGAIDKKTASRIRFPLMLWNIDPRDWDSRDAEKVKQHILDYAFDGGVVLLHDCYESTLSGAMAAVDELQAAGWQFVTLAEYYDLFDIALQPGVVYRGAGLADID